MNKLVSVHALNSRYQGEIGDVVVGRVVEVADKRWRLDCNSRQNAILMLSSVHLPGGVQRRRTAEDSLNMRNFFKEGDLISAEVQGIKDDGAISLHTRSLKYGKLNEGVFLSVPANLVKRCKQHFHALRCGVDVILGNNGNIWLRPSARRTGGSDAKSEDDGSGGATAEQREAVCRVRNSIVALAKSFNSIYVETIMDVYNQSVELGLAAREILDPGVLQRVTQTALKRTQARRTTSRS